MADPVKLQTVEEKALTAAQESIVEVLAEYLERATSGEFSSLALCYVRPDGSFGSEIARSRDGAMLLGATVFMQHEIVAGTIDRKEFHNG